MTQYRVYLDVCCLNRPFDDQSQSRIHLESEAILLIMSRFKEDEWQWHGSDALEFEINQTPNPERRRRVELLTTTIHHSIRLTASEVTRAKHLQTLGFKQWDALHLACAEAGQIDIFLTTDDKLIRLAHRLKNKLHVKVENPLTWLTEVTK